MAGRTLRGLRTYASPMVVVDLAALETVHLPRSGLQCPFWQSSTVGFGARLWVQLRACLSTAWWSVATWCSLSRWTAQKRAGSFKLSGLFLANQCLGSFIYLGPDLTLPSSPHMIAPPAWLRCRRRSRTCSTPTCLSAPPPCPQMCAFSLATGAQSLLGLTSPGFQTGQPPHHPKPRSLCNFSGWVVPYWPRRAATSAAGCWRLGLTVLVSVSRRGPRIPPAQPLGSCPLSASGCGYSSAG